MKEMIRRFGDVGGGHDTSLCLLAVLGAVALTVLAGVMVLDERADAFTVGDLVYEITADGEVKVADTVSEDISGEVVIPATVEGYSVTSIGDYAFYECHSVTSVTLPEGLKSIGIYAFSECYGLTSVTIPNGVTIIGGVAFGGCTNLTSIDVPDSVTTIDDGAFSQCYSLTSVTIPNGVTSISYGAFFYCSSLTSITIPNGVTSIGDEAFSLCTSLTSVTFESESAPDFGFFSFDTGTTINVYTPGWNPVDALTGSYEDGTTIVWANPYSDLEFTSNPIADGIYTYVGPKPLETN